MNYYGEVTDDAVPCIDVYRFLQSALRNVEACRPFRGPREFSNGAFSYRDQSSGDLDRFSAREVISYQGRESITSTIMEGASRVRRTQGRKGVSPRFSSRECVNRSLKDADPLHAAANPKERLMHVIWTHGIEVRSP